MDLTEIMAVFMPILAILASPFNCSKHADRRLVSFAVWTISNTGLAAWSWMIGQPWLTLMYIIYDATAIIGIGTHLRLMREERLCTPRS